MASIAERSAQTFGRPREEVLKEIDAVFAARGVKVGPAEGEATDGSTKKPGDEVSPSEKENSEPKKRARQRTRSRGR